MTKGMGNWLEPLVWASDLFLVISVVGKNVQYLDPRHGFKCALGSSCSST